MTADSGFFYRASIQQWMLRIFYGLCMFLVLIDFVVHRHVISDIEKFPAFYAIFGLVASIILLLFARLICKLLMRGGDYYQTFNVYGSVTEELAQQQQKQQEKP